MHISYIRGGAKEALRDKPEISQALRSETGEE
jgi:hypothetical protein